MGVIGAVIKVVIVPVVVVALIIAMGVILILVRQRRKHAKDIEQQNEPLPPFVNYACAEPVAPPTYAEPPTKPAVVVQARER